MQYSPCVAGGALRCKWFHGRWGLFCCLNCKLFHIVLASFASETICISLIKWFSEEFNVKGIKALLASRHSAVMT